MTTLGSLLSPLQLLASGDASEEGLDVIMAMLLVGLTFLGVIVVGDTLKAVRHRRKDRRRDRRAIT